MTISISVSPELEAELRRRAEASGKDITDIAREAVEEKLAIPQGFAAILAPIHQATAASGGIHMDELDSLVDECRNEVFAAKNSDPAR